MPISRSSFTECCVGLVFISPAAGMYGHERQVDVADVVAAERDAELADRFEERQRLDVADGAADFDDGYLRIRPAPCWIHALISSVMCGITCTVPPR